MKCIICEHETNTFKHHKFDMTFHECTFCEVIFKDPLNHLSETEELKIYEYHQNDLQNEGYVNFLTNFVDAAVFPFVKHSKIKALDFGSGPNPVLSHILKSKYGYDVDIFDYFYAKKRVFENQTYDLITSTEVIEHLQQPLEAFKLFKKHLKNEGILSVMTLFHPKDQEVFMEWFYIRDPSHIVFYTPKTFDVISDIVGLKLIFDNDHRYATFINT
jgi:SAM-dependent methyltransferase